MYTEDTENQSSVALAAVDALYAYFQNPFWCVTVLTRPVSVSHLHRAILDTKGHLAAQLTAAACLAQVCTSEKMVKQMPEDGTQRPTFTYSYINTASEQGSFASVVACMDTASKVSSLTVHMCHACCSGHNHCCDCLFVMSLVPC